MEALIYLSILISAMFTYYLVGDIILVKILGEEEDNA